MPNECYVIYAKHYNKETTEFEGVCVGSCVDTLEKVYAFFEHMLSKYHGGYVNEDMIYIDDAEFPFVENITYDKAICDFEGGN